MQQNFANFGLFIVFRKVVRSDTSKVWWAKWRGFCCNFSENTTVKEFGKSANICQSYERMYSGTVF